MTIANHPRDPLAAALRSADPLLSLRVTVRGMLAAGVSRPDILAALETLRAEVRQGSRPDDEDIVLDVMDAVTSWTSPQLRI